MPVTRIDELKQRVAALSRGQKLELRDALKSENPRRPDDELGRFIKEYEKLGWMEKRRFVEWALGQMGI